MEHKHVLKALSACRPIASLFLKPIVVELIFLVGKNFKKKEKNLSHKSWT